MLVGYGTKTIERRKKWHSIFSWTVITIATVIPFNNYGVIKNTNHEKECWITNPYYHLTLYV